MTELAPIALLWDGNHNYRLLLPTVPCVSAHVDVIRCRLLDDIDPPPQRSVALLFHAVTQDVPFILEFSFMEHMAFAACFSP